MPHTRRIKIGEQSDDGLTTNWEFEGDWDDLLLPILSILADAEAHSLRIDWRVVFASAGIPPVCSPRELKNVNSPADFMNDIFARIEGCDVESEFFDSDCPGGSSITEIAWVISVDARNVERTLTAIRDALAKYWTESGLEQKAWDRESEES